MTTDRIRASSARPGHFLGSMFDYFTRAVTAPMLYFCRAALDPEALKRSLREALTTHPVFAGAVWIEDHRIHLDCNNQGVPFTVSDLDLTLDELYARDPATYGPLLVDTIHGARTLRRRSPVLTVKLTRLRGGATALGICYHHSVGDLPSFMSFMDSWARAFRGEPAVEPTLVPDRDAYLEGKVPPGGSRLPMVRKPYPLEFLRVIWALARAKGRCEVVHMFFTEAETLRMQRAFSDQAGCRVSVGDAVTAQVMATVLRLDPALGSRKLGTAVNIRRHLGLPDDVLGNMFSGLLIDCAGDAPASAIAASLRKSLERFVEDHLDYNATKAFIAASGGLRGARFAMPRFFFDLERHNVFLTNCSRCGLYDTFVGDQRPELFLVAGEVPIPWLGVVAEGIRGEGRLVGLALPKEIAGSLRAREARAFLHGHRDRDDVLPDVATRMRWLL